MNHIEDFLSRIGITEMNFSVVDKDSFGDIITVFDPDTDYEDIRKSVIGNRAMRNKMVDSGLNYCEIHDTIYVDGNKTVVAILCEEGNSGFGTNIKIMVKRVDFMDGSEMKSFLSFESMKNYISRVSK